MEINEIESRQHEKKTQKTIKLKDGTLKRATELINLCLYND